MNKLITLPSPKHFFHPTFVAVQGVTEEGAEFTWAVIYRNKHGRSNMSRVGTGEFLAGGNGQKAVEKHARTRSFNDHGHYFIERGVARAV